MPDPVKCSTCREPIGQIAPRIEIAEQHVQDLGGHGRDFVAWAAVACSTKCAIEALAATPEGGEDRG